MERGDHFDLVGGRLLKGKKATCEGEVLEETLPEWGLRCFDPTHRHAVVEVIIIILCRLW